MNSNLHARLDVFLNTVHLDSSSFHLHGEYGSDLPAVCFSSQDFVNLFYWTGALDKSELVEHLLNAWVKWRQVEDSEILLSKISPRRKYDKEEKF